KPAIPMRNVVLATREIPPHTHLNVGMFAVQQRPADQVDPTALTSLDGVTDMVSQATISNGSVVTSGALAPIASLGLAVQLGKGMRAISIAVDAVKDVSDLLHPGDRVDVIAAPPRAGDQVGAFTIMRNIQVLSVGAVFSVPAVVASPAAGPQNTPPPTEARTVTLEVSPPQADMLTAADLNATLRLALRPPNEPPNSGLVEKLVYFSQTPAPPPQAPAPAAPAVQRPVQPVGVPVINGDQVGH
ncbi:MAG TPA: Flp pilus assembly protein CpaB, partial [Trinickia sp.]|nr:Flp pilus assembly protein CpaB [Trinickia sp.]